MRKTKDGWHKIAGFNIFVENGRVMRGIRHDINGSEVTAYPYRASKNGGWDNDAGLTVEAFKAGVRRGTVTLF